VNRKLVGVILAAGRGTRIKPLNLSYPKPLLPVCNKPIMQYQVEEMRAIGVTDLVVVVGHLKDEITSYFGDGSRLGVKIRYVEQKQMLGIAHAVAQLESVIDSPFILFLGDIFSVQKDLPGMAEMFWARKAGAVLAVKHEPNPEFIRRNFAVILHASGTVTRVIEKPRYLTNNLKGCGVYVFDLAIFDAIRRTPRTAQRDEYEITNSIQILIDDGYPVYPIETIEWDMNVTFANDLLECNHRQMDRMALDRLIGDNVRMPAGTVVERSVIGNNVVIRHPIAVRNSLVLADAVVDATEDLDHMLITPEASVRCAPETEGAEG
jgi:dTDP-glucose pyrophosphorylase